MTMSEIQSIENTLVRISIRTLYFIAAGLVIMTTGAVMCYNSLQNGQDKILSEIISLKGDHAKYEQAIQVLQSDDRDHEIRIVKLEK